MLSTEIKTIFDKGIRPIIQCLKEIESLDVDPDEGMRGRIVDIIIKDECFRFIIDWSNFESYNRQYAKPNYYDEKNVPCKTWFDQSWYQKHKTADSIYAELDSNIFEIVENDIYTEYQKSNSKDHYVLWLENQIRKNKPSMPWSMPCNVCDWICSQRGTGICDKSATHGTHLPDIRRT